MPFCRGLSTPVLQTSMLKWTAISSLFIRNFFGAPNPGTIHILITASKITLGNFLAITCVTRLLSSLDQLDVRTATSAQTFDFSTLYTSIPHDLLKSRISNPVHNAFR